MGSGVNFQRRALRPFWSSSSRAISDQLWLPTKIAGAASASTSSSGSSSASAPSLRCYTQSPATQTRSSLATSWRLSPSLQPATTDDAGVKTRKLRFYPSRTQKAFLRKVLRRQQVLLQPRSEAINARYDARKKEFAQSPTCVFCKTPKEEKSLPCAKHAKGAAVEARRQPHLPPRRGHEERLRPATRGGVAAGGPVRYSAADHQGTP